MAGRSAKTEIDPAWIQCGQGAELLGDDQRRVVWQHDAACSDPYGACPGSDVRQGDRRGRAGDTRHVMMLRHPISRIAQRLCMTSEIERIAQRLGGITAFGHRGEVEDG